MVSRCLAVHSLPSKHIFHQCQVLNWCVVSAAKGPPSPSKQSWLSAWVKRTAWKEKLSEGQAASTALKILACLACVIQLSSLCLYCSSTGTQSMQGPPVSNMVAPSSLVAPQDVKQELRC